MFRNSAMVLDVAGTMLKMYRVAKDIPKNVIILQVVTTHLVMEKDGRALVIPHIEPAEIMKADPQMSLSTFFKGKDDQIKISCSSTPVSEKEACLIILDSKAKIGDVQETLAAVCARCPASYASYCASGFIVDAEIEEVTYSVSTGGKPFPCLQEVLDKLTDMGIDIYVASGDSMRSLSGLTKCRGIEPENIYPASTPRKKEEVVSKLKDEYDLVVMVGDGLNDIYALKAADLGILTVQQDSKPSEQLIQAADRIINDITELPLVLREYMEDAT